MTWKSRREKGWHYIIVSPSVQESNDTPVDVLKIFLETIFVLPFCDGEQKDNILEDSTINNICLISVSSVKENEGKRKFFLGSRVGFESGVQRL